MGLLFSNHLCQPSTFAFLLDFRKKPLLSHLNSTATGLSLVSSYSLNLLLFYYYHKAQWPRKHVEEIIYLGLWSQEVRVHDDRAERVGIISGVGTKAHILNGKHKVGVKGRGPALGKAFYSQSQPSSDILSITRPYLQTYIMPPVGT